MKTKRGQKLCASCNTINGVRSFECKNCGEQFKMKKGRKGARKKKGQDFKTGDMTKMRKEQYWFANADKMSQMNAFNLTGQGYTYTWDDVFRDYKK